MRITKITLLTLVFFILGTCVCLAEEAKKMEEFKDQAEMEKRLETEQEMLSKAEMERAKQSSVIDQLTLPEDNTARLDVKEIIISGNTLVSTDVILANMPLVYNASDMPLMQADSEALYDLRDIHDVISLPGQIRQVSTRTIQGFTQYILSIYQQKHYGGIYVYVPREALVDGTRLVNDVLQINVLEATASSVRITGYDVDQNEREKTYLRKDLIEEWSPVRVNEVINRKKLDDFVNLLNLNPDRYISATISKGSEPNTLAVGYDVYESTPWHYYIQVDNSGTKDRRWRPRLGLINTNLTGRDDKLTLMTQISPDKEFEDNYAYYGAYEFPLFTPRLRITFFGGRSEFDVTSGGGFSFLGAGYFYGGMFRYNVFQVKNWFFDLTGSLVHEKSKINLQTNNPALIPLASALRSNDHWNLWSIGGEVHHRDDMSNTTLAFNHYRSTDEHLRFDTALIGNYAARINIDPDIRMNVFSAYHSQYLDEDKINRVSGTFKYIHAYDRLPPAKMTTFGGLYTVRGYDEDRVVADDGYLYSLQYEFDIVKYNEAKDRDAGIEVEEGEEKPLIRKFAPLFFIDGGEARTIHPLPAVEKESEDFLGIGFGAITEIGDHFEGAVYVGWPMKDVTHTDEGDAAINASFTLRW